MEEGTKTSAQLAHELVMGRSQQVREACDVLDRISTELSELKLKLEGQESSSLLTTTAAGVMVPMSVEAVLLAKQMEMQRARDDFSLAAEKLVDALVESMRVAPPNSELRASLEAAVGRAVLVLSDEREPAVDLDSVTPATDPASSGAKRIASMFRPKVGA